MKTYRYRTADWGSGACLKKPLADCRIALVTTAALYRDDQEPFDEEFKGGDFSYRIIPADTDLTTLRIGHRSSAFDHSGIEADKNLALPIERFQELVIQGRIGELNHRHLSFMGSVSAPGRLISQSAPDATELLLQDGVDAVFLTPV
jgi:D-proline reductase (dithiol) PrdB